MKKELLRRSIRSAAALALSAGLCVSGATALPARESWTVAQLQAQAALEAPALVALSPQDLYHVRVNGAPMQTDPLLTDVNGERYVGLRAVAQTLLPDAQITWDGSAAKVYKAGVLTLTAKPGQLYVAANDRFLYVPNGVRLEEGRVLVPLAVLLKAADAQCFWQPDGSLDIVTGSGGLESGGTFYDADDLYWLARIIYAESGNQPLSGKIAVGNVVLNRVSDRRFPNSVYAVIFQKNQFSPAKSGSIHRSPNAESVLAAKLCLDGAVALDDVLYFNQVGLSSWAARNRPYVATIAGHSFYG